MSQQYTLAVDTEDNYLESQDVFYIHPGRLSTLRCVQNNTFESCTIMNSPVANLSSLNFVTILEKLKPTGKLDVYVDQPITVMQDYDAKQIEANAKLAGFEEISIKDATYVKESTGKKVATLLVSGIKPEKIRGEIEIEVTKSTSTSGKKKSKY